MFGKKKKIKKKSYFTIEYYPLTKRYYPKYKNLYLKKDFQTGIIETRENYLFVFADFFKSEKEALEYIELFKELQFKKNVITIEVDDIKKDKCENCIHSYNPIMKIIY